jgi:hypothetical protein
MDRVDNDGRPADDQDQRTVYFWTWSQAPIEMMHPEVASIIRRAYEACQKDIVQMSVFREQHPSSHSERERRWHFHVVVQTTVRCRWREIANHMRQESNAYMHASTSSVGRHSYWPAFGYCFVPTGKKPLSELDKDYWLSNGHQDIPQRLMKLRFPSNKVSRLISDSA